MVPVVLVIVHDAFFSRTLSEKLRQLKASIFTASDAEEALLTCSRHDIDVVLLDVRRRESDTLQLLSSLRESYPNTEVILLSDSENIAVAMEGMRRGASDDIMVPFDIGSLKIKLLDALARKKSRDKKARKRSFFRIFGDAMVAATYAQAGEFETARELYSPEGKKKKKKKE